MTRRAAANASRSVPVVLLMMSVLTGCGGGRSAEAETARGRFQESPMLREQVEAGKLPPVEERLPDEPMVVEVPQIGEYGGSMGGGRVIQSDEWQPPR